MLQFEPQHFDAWFNLAVAKAKDGFLEEALHCFQKANELQNNNTLSTPT